jgi:hypothetical protein
MKRKQNPAAPPTEFIELDPTMMVETLLCEIRSTLPKMHLSRLSPHPRLAEKLDPNELRIDQLMLEELQRKIELLRADLLRYALHLEPDGALPFDEKLPH